jgi:hypothetical protein
MADVATLTLRADISELQRKLRSIPDEASGSAKQMAIALEKEFKRASAAAEAAAKASSAANVRAAAETERATQRLQEYLAAGDPVAELTQKFQRQAAEIEKIAKITGDAKGAQQALTKVSADYAQSLQGLTAPAQSTFATVKDGAEKAAGSNWKLNQQTLSLRKNVGDFANSLIAGQSPFTVLMQQGPQVVELFAEADSATALLQSSFGGLFAKAAALAVPLAAIATAVAAAVAIYSVYANATDENAEGNNRLAASFRKLTEEVDTSSDAINKQQAALTQLKKATDDRRESLLVEIGVLNEHDVAAKREADALRESTRATMLDITMKKAKLQTDLQTAEAVLRNRDANVAMRAEASQVVKVLRDQVKAEQSKIDAAQANLSQQLEDIDNMRLVRQVRDEATNADEKGTTAKQGLTKATKDESKANRDLAAAYETVQGILGATVEANASAERKLGIAAAERIKILTDIAEKYADQPDIVAKAAQAEEAVREQLRADLAAQQAKDDEAFDAAKQKLHERQMARAKELADQEERLQAQRIANAQAVGTFASGVSDLLAQRAEANAKRDRELALRQFKASKAAAVAEATINGAVAITRALATLGPVAGALATAGIAASTAAQIGVIASQKPAFDRGGLIQGGGAMADQVPVNALPGEAVLSRGAVRAIGGQAGVDRLNRGESTGPQVVVVEAYKHFGRFVQDELGRAGVLQRAMLAGRPVGALGY